MHQRNCRLLTNESIAPGYWRATFDAAEIAADAAPGQFVHIQLPDLAGHVLRRPFSVCNATRDGILTIVYKVVGAGTTALAKLSPGISCDIIGPLGHGFALPAKGRQSVMVGGGYGCAAMYFAARQATELTGEAPVVLLGARSAQDLLMMDEFKALGCRLETATNDGSFGIKGLVTLLLQNELQTHPDAEVAACGPLPMLKAVAKMCEGYPQADCQVSLDEIMCCGVGACFGCVVKCKSPEQPSGWCYRRSCKEGPVFKGEEIYWD